MSESGSPEVIHAFREPTDEGVSVVLTDENSAGSVELTPAFHTQLGRMLGLPEIGEQK